MKLALLEKKKLQKSLKLEGLVPFVQLRTLLRECSNTCVLYYIFIHPILFKACLH